MLVGTILIIASLIIPPHYAAANGQCIDRAGHDSLVSAITDNGRPVYGECADLSQIRLPDLRGRAIYGLDGDAWAISHGTPIIKIDDED